jgi:hypothetical protein
MLPATKPSARLILGKSILELLKDNVAAKPDHGLQTHELTVN